MKKTILSLALFVLAAAAGFAQSSVPIYGPLSASGLFPALGGVTVNLPADADYTLTTTQQGSKTLSINNVVSLTAARSVFAQAVLGKEFYVFNSTNQIINFGATTGAKVAIAVNGSASVYFNGTDYVCLSCSSGLTPPTAYANQVYASGALVTSTGIVYQAQQAVPSGNAPSGTTTATAYWAPIALAAGSLVSVTGDVAIAASGAATVSKYNGGTSFGSAASHNAGDFDAAGAAATAQTAAVAAASTNTAAAVAALSANPIAGASMELPMTDGTGTTVTDISGNGNNGTFGASPNAPTWYPDSVSFLDTGVVISPYQVIHTPLTTFGSFYIYHCTPVLVPTTGTAAGGLPYNTFPTFWGTTVNTSGLVLRNTGGAVNIAPGNSVFPVIFDTASSQIKTNAADSTAGCHVYGYSLGVSGTTTDHITVDGVEVGYTGQLATSAMATITGGTYDIGLGESNGIYGLRGRVAYVVAYPTGHTVAQMQAESAYITRQVLARPTFPRYPLRNNNRGLQVIGLGDSLTATYRGNVQWTSVLATTNTYNPTNLGIGGDVATDVCKQFDQRTAPFVVPGQTKVLEWAGTNDAYLGSPVLNTWASISACAAKAHQYGAMIGVGTMISRTGNSAIGITFDAYKDQLNSLIRTGWKAAGFDFLLDYAEVPALGADGAYATTTCFNSTDLTHLIGPTTGATCATVGTTALPSYGIIAAIASAAINNVDGYSSANPRQLTAAAYAFVSGDNVALQTPTASITDTLDDCLGSTFSRTISNLAATGSGFNITMAAVNSEAISGSAVVAPQTTAVFYPMVTGGPGSTTGGCSWRRQ